MFSQLPDISVEDIKRGYRREEGRYCCLLCGQAFCEGEVYPVGERFFTAEAAVLAHLRSEHPPVLKFLLSSRNRYLSFTDNQRQLLAWIGEGLSDAEIAKRSGISPSTVRHQRFTFREKVKQAKLLLAVCELAEAGGNAGERLVEPHPGATMVDDRYVMTEEERDAILKKSFSSLDPLRLFCFPRKDEKKKLVILTRIAREFRPGRVYTEKEVNDILHEIDLDYVTLRRYLIEYGFLDRKRDGSAYWVKEENDAGKEE